MPIVLPVRSFLQNRRFPATREQESWDDSLRARHRDTIRKPLILGRLIQIPDR
jgi:hypothetical protein